MYPADIDTYHRYLDECLMKKKTIPVQLIDYKKFFVAKIHDCINELHALHELIVYSCKEATRCSFSQTTKSKQSRCVLRWKAEHSLARDRSLFLA